MTQTRVGGAPEPGQVVVPEFLQEFGYLRELPRDWSGVREATDIEPAVALYQRLHGLPETGVLDPETLRWMNTPRCGVSDLPTSAFRFSSMPTPADGWRTKNITVAADLQQEMPRLAVSAIEDAIEAALHAWATAGGLTFRTVRPANIFIAFKRGDHGDGHPDYKFDRKPGGKLGHAFFPTSPRLRGHVHLDADENWTVGSVASGTTDLLTLLLHEIGHALGLPHNLQDPHAVMHERFEEGAIRQTLGLSDIEMLRRIYP